MALPKLSILIEEAIADLRLSNRKPVTIRGYVNNFRKVLTEELIENWRTELPKLSQRWASLAPATIKDRVQKIRWFFEWLVEWHDFDRRCLKKFETIELPPPCPVNPTYQTIRETIRAAARHSLEALVVFNLFSLTGVRKMAGLGLERRDVDLERGMISVRNNNTRKLKKATLPREVPICEALSPLLATWLDSRALNRRDRIFTFKRQTISNIPLNDSEGNPIPDRVTPKRLRAAFASALHDGIADLGGKLARIPPIQPARVSRILGHRLGTTMDYYYSESKGVPALNPDEYRVDVAAWDRELELLMV